MEAGTANRNGKHPWRHKPLIEDWMFIWSYFVDIIVILFSSYFEMRTMTAEIKFQHRQEEDIDAYTTCVCVVIYIAEQLCIT